MKLREVNAFSHVGPSVSHSVHKGANVTITHDPDALDLTVQTPLNPPPGPGPHLVTLYLAVQRLLSPSSSPSPCPSPCPSPSPSASPRCH